MSEHELMVQVPVALLRDAAGHIRGITTHTPGALDTWRALGDVIREADSQDVPADKNRCSCGCGDDE